nr:heat-inducible transcriptional repressor HrcA [Tissierella sp.]
MLDDRKLKVLYAIINSYIDTAEPIGSRTISKNFDLGVSSATIRNEMSDLEEQGFLNKPYSSSGRIPSEKAYRLYVDEIMKSHIFSKKASEDAHMKSLLTKENAHIEEIMQNAAKILSVFTNYTSIVASPKFQNSIIKQIQLVSLEGLGVLIVIVLNNGIIKNPMYKCSEKIDSDDLNIISNIINEELRGINLEELFIKLENGYSYSQDKREANRYKKIIDMIYPILLDSIEDLISIELYFEGLTNIFNFPEYRDVEKAKSLMSFIEDKDLILNMLANTSLNEGVDIIIGNENIYSPIKDISIITTTYKTGDKIFGRVGLIGPMRMDYVNLINTLKVFSKDINQAINFLLDE